MSGKNVGCDSSVLIPALSRKHGEHARCRPHLSRIGVLPAHVLLETFSWLTGMSGGGPINPREAHRTLLGLNMAVVQLPPGQYLRLLEQLGAAGRSGAAVYDAQIAATAKHHGLTLLSRDRRAAAVYDLLGVDYELV